MAREAKKEKKKREPRLARKQPLVSNSYSDSVERKDVNLIYEFIYGNRQHELHILIKGVGLLYKKAKTKKERSEATLLSVLIEDLYKETLKQKKRLYQKRMGEALSLAVEKAKIGNDKALFDIIAFDKEYLRSGFVQQRISKAQAENDSNFFELLAMTIKRKGWTWDIMPGNSSDERQKNLRKLMRRLHMVGYDFNQSNLHKKIYDIIEDLNEKTDKEIYPYPEHSGVIKKTLVSVGVLSK
jgi:hypothetical protein